jgi:amidohydrolase
MVRSPENVTSREEPVDRKAVAEERFAAVEQELKDINRWMYDNPEVAYEERNTSARLVEFLSANGFAVEYPAYGLETAFAARAGAGGPEVVICAEMDALPGVGHACGHNIIATAALGAGVAVAGMADDLGFRVTVLGTPAEEHYGGKVDLIDAGAFAGAAASMMVHPSPSDVVDPLCLAIYHFSVTFHGKDAHASASPWEGKNALDAFVQLYVNVSTFRQQMMPTDKMHGIITHGGDAPNITPSMTKSEWYVRAATDERLNDLMDRFRAFADAAASATGCTVELEMNGNYYSDLVSDPVMTELYLANTTALGRPMARGADEDPSAAGSTDMGNVSHVVPSIHPMVGMDTQGAVNHQPEFAAHTVTTDGEQAMRDGALAMAYTIVDLAEGDRWGDLREI